MQNKEKEPKIERKPSISKIDKMSKTEQLLRKCIDKFKQKSKNFTDFNKEEFSPKLKQNKQDKINFTFEPKEQENMNKENNKDLASNNESYNGNADELQTNPLIKVIDPENVENKIEITNNNSNDNSKKFQLQIQISTDRNFIY